MSNSDSDFGPISLGGLIAGFILLSYSFYLGVQTIRYAVGGSKVMGRVTGSHQGSSRSGTERCSYDFVADGKPYSGSSDSCYLEIGAPVTVHYLVNNPNVNQHASPNWGMYQWIVSITGLFSFAFGVRTFMCNSDLSRD